MMMAAGGGGGQREKGQTQFQFRAEPPEAEPSLAGEEGDTGVAKS